MDKMQESIKKDQEKLKNKHAETAQLLKLKVLEKKPKRRKNSTLKPGKRRPQTQ